MCHFSIKNNQKIKTIMKKKNFKKKTKILFLISYYYFKKEKRKKKKKDGCLGWCYFTTATQSSRHPSGHCPFATPWWVDDQFYSLVWWVLIHNHHLADLGRAQARLTLENIFNLREKLVILEPQVTIGQRFECQKIHKGK
jgi:hypothetical protein